MLKIKILKTGKFALSNPANPPIDLVTGVVIELNNTDADLLIENKWAEKLGAKLENKMIDTNSKPKAEHQPAAKGRKKKDS